MRLVQLLFAAVEEGRLKLPWIYPETAAPTRKLVIGLLWLFALVSRYPYLPGSRDRRVQGRQRLRRPDGVARFQRARQPGDERIHADLLAGAAARATTSRVGDVEGTVTHMGTLSTKIETPRREEVTIPNAVLVSQVVTNFARNAGRGVFVADRGDHRLRRAVAEGRGAACCWRRA